MFPADRLATWVWQSLACMPMGGSGFLGSNLTSWLSARLYVETEKFVHNAFTSAILLLPGPPLQQEPTLNLLFGPSWMSANHAQRH